MQGCTLWESLWNRLLLLLWIPGERKYNNKELREKVLNINDHRSYAFVIDRTTHHFDMYTIITYVTAHMPRIDICSMKDVCHLN